MKITVTRTGLTVPVNGVRHDIYTGTDEEGQTWNLLVAVAVGFLPRGKVERIAREYTPGGLHINWAKLERIDGKPIE